MFEKTIPQNNRKLNKNIELLLDNPDILTEINESEYIYLDKIDFQNIKSPIFQDKIIITKKINQYFMFENTKNTVNPDMTKLNYTHIVDIIILNSNNSRITKDMAELVDIDTLIVKNLGNNIIYLEDKRKNIKIILTEFEKIILKNDGLQTQLENYEILN